jgi:hypothetical protein
MDANSNRAGPVWLWAFDELAAFRDRVFAKVGERPHAHQEKVDWVTFNCAECIEWQKRYDAAFEMELANCTQISGLLNLTPQQREYLDKLKDR